MDRYRASSEAGAWWRRRVMVAAAVALIVLGVAPVAAPQAAGLNGVRDVPWAIHIQTLDEALAQNDVTAAARAWHAAYLAALGSPRWEGMVAVGDASLRLGEVSGARQLSEARARNTYLAAFFRAHQQNALEGVLRTAQAFAALGDREVVEAVLRVAERLAAEARDREADARMRASQGRWAVR